LLTLVILYIILLAMGLLPIFTDVNVDFSGAVAGFGVGLCMGVAFWPAESRWYHLVRALAGLAIVAAIVGAAVAFSQASNGANMLELAETIEQLCK
jgi:hypothetical protein